jgi:hydroxyacylglutathione hydrolase
MLLQVRTFTWEVRSEMIIKRFINGNWAENCYVVSSNRDVVIIDPGGNLLQIVEYIDTNKFIVHAVLNTHAHFDHIGAVAEIKEKYNCPFYLHSKDNRLLRSANLYMKVFSGERALKIPAVSYFFDQIVTPLTFGSLSIDILFTPGHTEGSVCFLIGGNLFTGDTLLKGKVGRVDLPGGNKEKIQTSLADILKLPGELLLYPGHGESSSIVEELNSMNSLTKIN